VGDYGGQMVLGLESPSYGWDGEGCELGLVCGLARDGWVFRLKGVFPSSAQGMRTTICLQRVVFLLCGVCLG
ncbi:MAG: hypothetical protein ACK57O_22710, partial [Planctomyces sp.]